MILVAGNTDFLTSSMLQKFQDVRLHAELETDESRLLERMSAHASAVDALCLFVKRRNPDEDLSGSYSHLQQVWSVASKFAVPLLVIFSKYNTGYGENLLARKYCEWIRKQYRKPPFHYICLTGEVYGGEDTGSHVYRLYRAIVESGHAVVHRCVDSCGSVWEPETDYLYVLDLVRVVYWLFLHRPENGRYEIGSGFARTDTAEAKALSRALGRPAEIEYVDEPSKNNNPLPGIPALDLSLLRRVGYKKSFYPVEKGVKSYVNKHLKSQ